MPSNKANTSINDVIENLSKKKHILSEEAQEKSKERIENLSLHNQEKRLNVLREFSYSVDLLAQVFKTSHFDELSILLANPNKLILINLLIGVVRGIGFTIGVLLLLTVIIVLLTVFSNISVLSILPIH